jgi:protein-tyrosine phosphatase
LAPRVPTIDWHCHILPGIDDGPQTLTESLEMARILCEHGYRQVCCTPHCIRGAYDNTPGRVRRAVAELQAALDREAIPLRLLPGMEYYLDEFFVSRAEEILPLGDSRLVLVEAPSQGNIEVVGEGIFRIVGRRLTPLFAHPERCALLAPPGTEGHFEKAWTRFSTPNAKLTAQNSLEMLKEMGCLFQGNLGSFSGAYGQRVAKRAREMLGQGLYSCLGTDGHRTEALHSCLSASSAAERGIRELLVGEGGMMKEIQDIRNKMEE